MSFNEYARKTAQTLNSGLASPLAPEHIEDTRKSLPVYLEHIFFVETGLNADGNVYLYATGITGGTFLHCLITDSSNGDAYATIKKPQPKVQESRFKEFIGRASRAWDVLIGRNV